MLESLSSGLQLGL